MRLPRVVDDAIGVGVGVTAGTVLVTVVVGLFVVVAVAAPIVDWVEARKSKVRVILAIA